MKKWREICDKEAERLQKTLELHETAAELARHRDVSDCITQEDLKSLERTRSAILDKISHLKRGEFNIGVVGAEKTGKSSFINAWIDSDLLPNEDDRCTFTTTRLHSVLNQSEQRLEVRTMTSAEFNDQLAQLEELANSGFEETAAKARNNLETIRTHRSILDSLLDQQIEPIPFKNLDEIKPHLKRYAADERYAHAIAQVDLYTTMLANLEGIQFHDVPGIDSGLKKHEEETRDILKECDAVIMLKRLSDPAFKDSEQKILQYAKNGDRYTPYKDKLFIFYSRIDDCKTREQFVELHDKVREKCRDFAIDESKILFGVAPASLYLEGKHDTPHNIAKNRDEFKRHVREIRDLPDTGDATIINMAGIGPMKDRMNAYLEQEREAILRKNCDTLIGEIENLASNIRMAVRGKIPDDPEAQIKAHQSRVNEMFEKWFSDHWKAILKEMHGDDANEIIEECAKRMLEAYIQRSSETIDELEHFKPEVMESFFDTHNTQLGGELYKEFNSLLRREINEELIPKLHELAASLSWTLYDSLERYMRNLGEKSFNDAVDLPQDLLQCMNVLPAENYRRQLESAIGALFLRYARPLARGLIQYSHGEPERAKVAQDNANAFMALVQYGQDSGNNFVDIRGYISGENARSGGQTTKAPTRNGDKVGTKGTEVESRPEKGMPVYNSRQDVIDELEKDRKVLKEYLVNSIFACAGLEDYARYEMERIRRTFMKNEDHWRGRALTEYLAGNTRLLELMPENLRNPQCDTRIAELLQNLTLYLAGAHASAERSAL